MNALDRWIAYMNAQPFSCIRDEMIELSRSALDALDLYGRLRTYLRANTLRGVSAVRSITGYMGALEREMNK